MHLARPDINKHDYIFSKPHIKELYIQQQNKKSITKCKKILHKLCKNIIFKDPDFYLYNTWGCDLIYLYTCIINDNESILFTLGLCFFGANELCIKIINNEQFDIMLRILDDILYFSTTGKSDICLPSSQLFYEKKNKVFYKKCRMNNKENNSIYQQFCYYFNYLQFGELFPKFELTELIMVD